MVLFGPPGSGKGTQASILSEKFGAAHISTGDTLREALAKGTEVGLKAKAYMDKGELVPDEVVIAIAKDKLASAKELLQAEEEATIETAKTLIREAKWLVQEAHALLEMIKQAVRELGGEPCAEAQEIAIEGDATVTIPTPPVTP